LFFLLKSLIFAYAVTLILIITFADRIVFFPLFAKRIIARPSDIGFKYERSVAETADGAKLNCWYITCSQTSEISMFVAHGNAENISAAMYQSAYSGNKLGVNIFLYDYRGYGESTGSPSIGNFYSDAETAYNHFLNIAGVKKHKIIIYGRSLGGAAAVYLASKFDCYRLITESTFSSVRSHVWYNKVLWAFYPFTPNYLPSVEKAVSVKAPWLIIHGADDAEISVENAYILFDSKGLSTRRKYIVPGAGHNDLFMTAGPDAYCARIAEFLK
ncbi:MAG TPA: alpha/beta hydrolase, partial [Candidatus Wallbacteria bacterium]|nr:alpha/beta hydrolase [Candidatus Wallbacteria bacterium]